MMSRRAFLAQQRGFVFQRNHPPGLEHGDAVAQGFRFFQIMGGQHNGVAGAVELLNKHPQALPQLDIHPAVGSSSTITGGRCTSACATITRRFMPPDSARILALALLVSPACAGFRQSSCRCASGQNSPTETPATRAR